MFMEFCMLVYISQKFISSVNQVLQEFEKAIIMFRNSAKLAWAVIPYDFCISTYILLIADTVHFFNRVDIGQGVVQTLSFTCPHKKSQDESHLESKLAKV